MTAITSDDAAPRDLPRWLVPLLAGACGLIVANLYYAQPLAGPISAELGLSPAAAGLVVTMTQVGYGLGLLFVVPLGDLVENRRLIVGITALGTLALALAAAAPDAMVFLAAALMIGIGSVAVQVIVPYSAHLVPEAVRGRTVGNVMSGLMVGIMLARPVASGVTAIASWRAVFAGSVIAMVGLMALLWRALPARDPAARLGYAALLGSMARLARSEPVLRRRALYQGCLFAAFSLFWTVTPLLLAGPVYRLSQGGIALFALAGGAGAIAAPIAGRMADRGHVRAGSGAAMALAAASFALTRLAAPGSPAALALLAAAGVLLDFGVTGNLVLGQRAIFGIGASLRGRLNGLFMAFFFAGGAAGSAVGAWAYARGGWALASAIGGALPLLALLYYATEWGPRATARASDAGDKVDET